MEQRLGHWSSSFLSWNSRVVLLKHVLLAIPTYHMLMVGMNPKAGKELEAICKCFLWGSTEHGRRKKPLIAWERIIRPKYQEGLGFLSLVERANSLQMRYITQIIDGREVAWVHIMRQLISRYAIVGGRRAERGAWSAGDIRVAGKRIPLSKYKFPNNLLKVWKQAGKYLQMKSGELILPSWLPITMLRQIHVMQRSTFEIDFQFVIILARRLNIHSIGQLRRRSNGDLNISAIEGKIRLLGFEHVIGPDVLTWIEEWQIAEGELSQMPVWEWSDGQSPRLTWTRTPKDGVHSGDLQCLTLELEDRREWVTHCCGLEGNPSFIQLIDRALKLHHSTPGCMVLVASYCTMVWNDRNKMVFENKQDRFPLYQMAKSISDDINSIWRHTHGEEADRRRRQHDQLCTTAVVKAREIQDRRTCVNRLVNDWVRANGNVVTSSSAAIEETSMSSSSYSDGDTETGSEDTSNTEVVIDLSTDTNLLLHDED
ncbi:hypothetical protein R1sor_015043 [Riccia sorocarpa]|uniref:Uncharacterized protein n=1 Tax=Riccia sorocarpa TaxID=122646 RepID=A0ABD3HF04_9MARC